MSDPSGNWPKWATKLVAAVAVVAVVAAVAAVTVATAGAGTAIAAVAVGAANGAAIGFAVGAASGAAIGYAATGTLEGTLNGMADGALSGSISGAITGVGDALTTTVQVGIQYKNDAGLAAKAKAAVLSGRATSELELFGWQIEFGVSGDLLSVGAEAMIGVFPDEGFTEKASVGAGLFGGGFVFRIKPKQYGG